MKNVTLLLLTLSTVSGCALGTIDEKIDYLETTIDGIETAQCFRACDDTLSTCLDDAAGPCADSCEEDKSICKYSEEYCVDLYVQDCSGDLPPDQFYWCVESVKDNCAMNCGADYDDCLQVCTDEAQVCFDVGSECVAVCLDEFQATLKNINL